MFAHRLSMCTGLIGQPTKEYEMPDLSILVMGTGSEADEFGLTA